MILTNRTERNGESFKLSATNNRKNNNIKGYSPIGANTRNEIFLLEYFSKRIVHRTNQLDKKMAIYEYDDPQNKNFRTKKLKRKKKSKFRKNTRIQESDNPI